MRCSAKKQLFVLLLFKHGIILVITFRCQSPQYVILGQQGIIECQFPRNFSTVAWFDSSNETAVPVAKIERQGNGELEVSGDGYDSGTYNIFLNGSLVISSATISHDRTFKVLLLDENFIRNSTHIVVTTTVHSSETTPAVDLCGTDDPCFVNSVENDVLNCTYTGARPAAVLTWYAESNNRNKITNVNTASYGDENYTFTSISTLDITAFTDNPLTVFRCEASGPALGFEEVSTSVFVYDIKNGMKSRDASITDKNVVLNSSLQISCTKLRSPTAFVWSFQRLENSRVLVTSANSKINITDSLNDVFRVSSDGTLNITHVDYHLEGVFTCTFLEAGKSSFSSVRVAIIDGGVVSNQKSPAVLVIVIVLIVIIVVLCCVAFFYIRKRMQSKESNGEYGAVKKASEDLPEEEDKQEVPLQPPGDREGSCAIELENVETAVSESEEKPAEKPAEETPLQSTTSEQEHHDDEVTNPENITADPKAEPPVSEEACPADKPEDPANANPEDTSGDWTAVGAGLSNWRLKVDHEHKQVDSVREVEKGDHIVFFGWLLHPRCHGIVVDTNVDQNKVRVVRFTYEKGVVEEWKAWKQPTYKVLKYYIGGKTLSSNIYSPDAVVERARSMLNNDKLKYNIGTNNCKTFARWCKTDATPAGCGYD